MLEISEYAARTYIVRFDDLAHQSLQELSDSCDTDRSAVLRSVIVRGLIALLGESPKKRSSYVVERKDEGMGRG